VVELIRLCHDKCVHIFLDHLHNHPLLKAADGIKVRNNDNGSFQASEPFEVNIQRDFNKGFFDYLYFNNYSLYLERAKKKYESPDILRLKKDYGKELLEDELIEFVNQRSTNEYRNMDNNDKAKVSKTNIYILYCMKKILNLDYHINKWKDSEIEKEEVKKRDIDYLTRISTRLSPDVINIINKMKKNNSYFSTILNGFFNFIYRL
jgi:hypothetical protein